MHIKSYPNTPHQGCQGEGSLLTFQGKIEVCGVQFKVPRYGKIITQMDPHAILHAQHAIIHVHPIPM